MKLKSRKSVAHLQTLKQQQLQIITQLNDINEQHQQKTKEYMNKQQLLTDQLQSQQQFITMQELKCAIVYNNWTQKVGYFLNPLATQNINEINYQQQQTLLKHSEQKLILLERIFQTDSKIVQYHDQTKMIHNDIQGRIEQMNSLLIEYEELEEVVESWQNKEQSELMKKMFSINKSLSQMKLNYINLANSRQEKEQSQLEITDQITNLELQIRQIQIEKQIKGLQFKQFNVDQLVSLIVSSTQHQIQLELFGKITLLINDKVIQAYKLKTEKRHYKHILAEINQIELDNNFTVFDPSIFDLDIDQMQDLAQFVANELPKRISKVNLEKQLRQLKTILLDSQRQIHQIMYEQSMLQCQYNRLEMTLPSLEQHNVAAKLQQILHRMNHIECIRSQNCTLFDLTFPAQIKQIQQNISSTEQQLNSFINDLVYCTKIEQDYFHKLFPTSSQQIPQLILDKITINENLESQIDHNRQTHQQQQQLYHQTITNLKNKLQQLNEQEGTTQQQAQFLEFESLNRKENIPPSEDTSMLGTIQIDMSQERTTHKYSVFRSRKQMFMNEPTDRSLSSYSLLGHRTSDPLCSRTKLTLKQQISLSSFQKNPLLSPQSHHISIEQSLSLHSSARRFPDMQIEKSPQFLYKVLKRVHRMQSVSAFSSKYVKYNQKMKCLEFYNSNRLLHDLGQKESALCMRQIKEIKCKGTGLELLVSKSQKIELVFSKYEQLIEFAKLLKQ